MLYIKIFLCAIITSCSCLLAVKKASSDKHDAEVLRSIAQCFLLFKEGITLQRKSVPDMLKEVNTEVSDVNRFFSEAYALISTEPEISLNEIIDRSADKLNISGEYLAELKPELKFIASALEQTYEIISTDQIDAGCSRIIKIHDRAMDKYRDKLHLYKRVGIVFGIAISLFIV